MVQSVSCLQALWTDGRTDGQTDGQTPAPYHNTSRQVGRIKNSGQEFINNIKKDVTNEIRVDISTVVNNQLKEYEDIRKRELNIIMFNVPEKMDTNSNVRQRKDLEDINSISTSLGLTDELEVTAQFRLGKTKMNAIRLLKVILKNKSQRKFLLENA